MPLSVELTVLVVLFLVPLLWPSPLRKSATRLTAIEPPPKLTDLASEAGLNVGVPQFLLSYSRPVGI